jgi:hypothetical protein
LIAPADQRANPPATARRSTGPPRPHPDAFVSYGWGMIPVTARIGGTGWKTSLFPKDGRYIVPVKAAVRRAEGLEAGDTVTVRLVVGA